MVSYRIKNVKSFVDSGEIEMKPITILVGRNSCGKSSLLRFPAVLSQTVNYIGSNPPISFFGENVDYGNFEDVVFGRKNDEISFSLCYNVDVTGNTRISFDEGGTRVFVGNRNGIGKSIQPDMRKTKLEVTIYRVGKSLKVKCVQVFIDEICISSLCWDNDIKKYVLTLTAFYENGELTPVAKFIEFPKNEVTFEKIFPIYEGDILDSIINTYNMVITDERKSAILKHHFLSVRENEKEIFLSDEEKDVAETYKVFEYSTKIMSGLFSAFNIECKNRISYIGPFRKNPDRIYRNSETIKNKVGSKGENVGDILARAYQNEDDTLYTRISEQIRNYFGYELNIQDFGNNYFQLVLKDKNNIESNLIDVGFGVSQALPIISEVCLCSLKKTHRQTRDLGINDVMLIEQPELHLHPAAQAKLADLFAMCIESNSNARFIIETHSEHLIRKLQVLIADEDSHITKEMVQVLYVDKDENGVAFINEMEINENGKFEKEWPTGFFDQGYSLTSQLLRVAAKRKDS